MAKGQFLCGLLETEEEEQTTATVTDTRTVYTPCRSAAPPNGKQSRGILNLVLRLSQQPTAVGTAWINK